MKTTEKRGFSLIELMTVISILGILASVILVNVNGSRIKARDNAVYMQIASTQSLAFKCLTNGMTNVALKVPAAGDEICSTLGYSKWPVLTADSGWEYTNFTWCNVSTKDDCGLYIQGTCGGNNLDGSFCYKFNKDVEYVLCTNNGCEKSW
ncbi:MAG TPA: hypothetical protein DCX32_00525 [Candidatus Moranbacteria bacterium]|nr:MAG: hypothetical protein UW95_C0002G0074 [Parcubacteria group bacterium GW2011_GWC1_45_14]HAV11022.1 hypothetical protein [Candidatus Moranbacteria bacterium]